MLSLKLWVLPIFGVSVDTLKLADGIVPANSFKYGNFENHMDLERVKQFVEQVKTIR